MKGIQFAFGFVAPQFLIQFTPLFWGIAASWSDKLFAIQVGPLAVKLQWRGFCLQKFAGWFDEYGPIPKENK